MRDERPGRTVPALAFGMTLIAGLILWYAIWWLGREFIRFLVSL